MNFAESWGTVCSETISPDEEEAEAAVLSLCNLLGFSGRDKTKPLTTNEFGVAKLQNQWFYSGRCLQSLKMTLCTEGYYGTGSCDSTNEDSAVGVTCNGKFYL